MSQVWQTWPDIDDQNGTLDINTIAYFKGVTMPVQQK